MPTPVPSSSIFVTPNSASQSLSAPIGTSGATTVQALLVVHDADISAVKTEVANFAAYDFVLWFENQLL